VPFQRLEVIAPIANEPIDIRKKMGVRAATVEKSERVATIQRVLNQVRAYEPRTTQDQDPKRVLRLI
jgi:hypothetical protein